MEYRKGGLHPVNFKDKLGDEKQLEVVAKLGWGAFSTVWLCRNTREEKWCAVKILAAEKSSEDCRELRIMKRFRDRADPSHVLLPTDSFWIQGPNGRHLCLVMPVMGPSLADFMSQGEIELPIIKELLFQLGHSLKYLQQQGIVHGSFRRVNMLLGLEDISHLSQEAMIMKLGKPLRERVRTAEGKPHYFRAPEYLIEQADMSCVGVKPEIVIADFGMAFHHDYRYTDGVNTTPEAYFGNQLSFSSDVWGFAMSIAKTRLHSLLFSKPPNYVKSLEMLLGPLDPIYREAYFRQQEEETEEPTKEEVRRRGPDEPDIWVSRKVPEKEATILADLFYKVFKYNPKERIDIDAVLQHRWFNG
ncbi:kinase-like domain-containing protein, partial [Pseudomassariella vexata]